MQATNMMQQAASIAADSKMCPVDTRVTAQINSVESLEHLISQLNPCHLAHRQYYELKAQASWGKIAKWLIYVGVGYNIALIIAVIFLR